jgi:Leucine-rich repeat (LRR) protein
MANYFIQERPRSRLREMPPLPNPLAISQLNYSHNDIRCIPLQLTSAVHLQMLDLSHNKLAHLAHLQLLTELRFCNFSHNLLTELPPSLAQLAHLQHIDVSHNRISIVANVRVLKELVERRLIVGGAVEVCLEGNEVMRRKGCRETIRAWLQVGQPQAQGEESWDSYEKGSRRAAKSLELPCGRDSQLTQRTMLLRVKEI